MICSHFLLFSWLPFILLKVCCTEAFKFDVVPLIYFGFWCQIEKKNNTQNIAKTSVKKLIT